MITLSIISLFLVFASFWIYGYAKETYSAAGDAQNSVYQFVFGKEIKKYSDDRYLVVISEASENSSTKNVNIFVKTPFNRAVPYISSDIPATNFYGNAFNYSGNSTIDDKMFCILYGFNKTGDYVAIETGGKEYKKQIEQGYFVITVLADIIGDAKVSFYDSDGTDISIQFEPMTGTLDSQQ